MKIYLVGGAVRDLLLKKPEKDKDYVVVGSTPDEMLSLGYDQVGESFPVFLHPETKDEYALARKERKTSKGYAGFSFDFDKNVTLEEDLLRRDLTINAIAMDLETKEIIDPYGGAKDLEDKIIRPVSEAFMEDPVRVLRAARFAAKYDFSFSKEIFPVVKEMKESGELSSLTGERVLIELEKAFELEKPSVFFDKLKELDVLDVVFPHIHRLIGVEQNPLYHPEGDCYIHTMLVLDKAREKTTDFKVLYTALVHDLGKGVTPKEILPKHIGHEEGGLPLVKEMSDFLRVDRRTKEFAMAFCKEHLNIHRSMEIRPTKVVRLLRRLRATKVEEESRLRGFLLCSLSDSLGKNRKEYIQADYLMECFKAIQKVKPKDLIKEGFSKDKIKQVIEEAMSKEVNKVKEKYK
tara:strand:+ start:11931 stop:13148 length:1218 start_codon:yes stop_codon:yes gene_type:complete